LKLDDIHQILVYADDVNTRILGGSVHTIKKNTEAGKNNGLEVYADETTYMAMLEVRIAGRSQNIKTDNCSLERMEEFKYLGTPLTNQNSMQEEIKSRLNPGNSCYHSMQNLLYSCLLSKNLKIKTYRTILLPVICMGVKLGRPH
jgi:hypothetical protein